MLGLYRASTWARGRLGIVIPWNPDAAAAANALWRGIAWARGKREGGPRGSVRERERGANGRARARGFGIGRWGRPARASVACAWPAGGLRSALAGPVGLAGAWGFPLFFELERRENIEKYILFLYRTYIYQNSQGN